LESGNEVAKVPKNTKSWQGQVVAWAPSWGISEGLARTVVKKCGRELARHLGAEGVLDIASSHLVLTEEEQLALRKHYNVCVGRFDLLNQLVRVLKRKLDDGESFDGDELRELIATIGVSPDVMAWYIGYKALILYISHLKRLPEIEEIEALLESRLNTGENTLTPEDISAIFKLMASTGVAIEVAIERYEKGKLRNLKEQDEEE
jgi:hypothetical protein